MVSPSIGVLQMKPSFAKVAAMAPPSKPKALNNDLPKPGVSPQKPELGGALPARGSLNSFKTQVHSTVAAPNAGPTNVDSITRNVGQLSIKRAQKLPAQSSDTSIEENSHGGAESTEDDQSQASNSSTKGPNFDTKSMASVTTFAMDEKESLRPDDSASVQAADEDEHISPPTSGAASSNVGSESRPLPVVMPPRDDFNGVSIVARRAPRGTLVNPPHFGNFPIEPVNGEPVVANSGLQSSVAPDVLAASNPRLLAMTPDEKLIDAMGMPRERLLLLQLEQRLLSFITQSRDDSVDLPLTSSYERLLAHKLADYYNLAHVVGDDSASVRLFRTAFIALPTPLNVIAGALPTNGAQPAGAAAVRIMRRTLGQGKVSADGSTAASSSVPSKATSDAGADTTSDEGQNSPAEAALAKDKSKWTREEKEAHYKAARERIFGDFQATPASENNSTGDVSASMSRSSSSSGKKKTLRQRAPKDDSFEARSQFMPGFGNMTYSAVPTQYPNAFGSQTFPNSYANATGYGHPANFGATPPSFGPYDAAAGYSGVQNTPVGFLPSYQTNEAWPGLQGPPHQTYYGLGTPNQASPAYSQHSSPGPPSVNPFPQPSSSTFAQSSPNWSQPYAGPYQHQLAGQNQSPLPWPSFTALPNASNPVPYQYGQLPPQSFGGSPPAMHQHPLPGSFNRSIFNPQTSSFVPANGNGKFNSKAARSAQPRINHLNLGRATSGFSETTRRPDLTSTNSMFSSSPSQLVGNGVAQGEVEADSLQKKYGAPPNLPKKPPPSQVPSAFDIETTPVLLSQQPFPAQPQHGNLNHSSDMNGNIRAP